MASALECLASGEDSDPALSVPPELTGTWDENRVAWGSLMDALSSRGALCHELRAGDRTLLRVTPAARGLIPLLGTVDLKGEVVLCREAFMRSAGGGLVLASPLAPAAVELCDPQVIEFVVSLAARSALEPPPCHALSPAAIELTLSILLRLGLAVDETEQDRAPGWGFSDLQFHASSGHARFPDPAAYTSVEAPASTLHPRKFGERIIFPPLAETGVPEYPFLEVLDRRRSIRAYDDDSPMAFGALGELLGRSARVRGTVRAGERSAEYEFTNRPYPSPGALYPLELYAVVRICDGVEPGIYHYEPASHALEPVSDPTLRSREALGLAAQAMGDGPEPQVLLVMTARPARVSWKYGSSAYALLLKEVGALMQTLYLVATWMDLAPCALGSGDGLLLPAAHDADFDPNEVSVGAFCLGSAPPPARGATK